MIAGSRPRLPACIVPPVRRLGLGSALGLLVLGRVLLDASVLLFVGIAIAARGVDYGTAVRIVATDPLPLGAAQLAALGAVTSLGVWLWTPAEQPAPALGLVATRRRFALVAALAGVALQLPMVELTTLIARIWPALVHTPEQDAMIETLTRVSSPLRAITVPFTFVVIAPVTEELLFRGLILRSLRTRYGRAVAIGVTAVLFAVFHLDPQALVFATLIGIVLGVIADRARSIVPSIALHAGFNQFYFSPRASTLGILLVLPPLLWAIFLRSERSVGDWLGRGFDADTAMLELLNSGEFADSPVGRYLHALRGKFEGPVVADLLCYVRLHTELSLRAKGILMMRESGFDPPVDQATRDTFAELAYLEKSIGRTGVLAIQPMLAMSHRDLWQLYMLGK